MPCSASATRPSPSGCFCAAWTHGPTLSARISCRGPVRMHTRLSPPLGMPRLPQLWPPAGSPD